MDGSTLSLAKSYTKQEITQINQTITNVTNQVTSGIKSIVPNGSQLIFTLGDDTQISITLTGLSDENFTTILKTKLGSMDSILLNRFTYVDSQLLFDGNPIIGESVDLSDYFNKTEINNLLTNKVDKDGIKILTDVNFSQIDKNKLDTLENFSKDYTELINKPTIPSILGLASETYVDNKIASIPSVDLTPYEKIVDSDSKLANKSDITHTHEITDVIGLIDKFTGYYTKVETLSTTEINTLVNNISKGMSWKESVESVATLPLVDNIDTDTRITKDTLHINIWSTSLNKWIDLGGSDTIPMASEVIDGKMSKEQYSKLESIVVNNLVTTQQLADGLATKSDTTHTHSNYVEKEVGKSLVLDSKVTEWDAKADVSSIPTKTSNLTNDSDFATNASVDSKLGGYQTETQINTKLVDYAKVTDVSTKTQVNDSVTSSITDTYSIDKILSLISTGGEAEIVTVETLPEIGQNNKIYILSTDFSLNYYDGSVWHTLGSNQIVIGTSNSDTTKLWLDTTTTPTLKWHNGTDWINISGGSSTGATINDTSTTSTTETYSVNKINSLIDEVNNTNFTNANEAKTNIINSIGDSSLAISNTFVEISNTLLAKKQSIVDALASKSVIATPADDLMDYATDINNIVQNSTIKNTKLNKSVGETTQVVLTNPTTIQNISTSVLEYQAGNTGVVQYDCDFNNGDSTSFNTTSDQHLIFDGMMKQDNNIKSITMTNEGTIDAYTVYSANLDKTDFNKINRITEATVDTNEILTITGTYNPTLVQANSDISLVGIDRISDIVWTASATNTSKLLLIYSIDGGITWKGYDSVNHIVLDITSITDLSEIQTKGISIANLNAFTQTDLDNIRNSSPKIRFAYYLEKNDIADTLQNDKITLTVDMTGEDIFSTHYSVGFDGVKTLTYTFNANNTYTIVYTDNN